MFLGAQFSGEWAFSWERVGGWKRALKLCLTAKAFCKNSYFMLNCAGLAQGLKFPTSPCRGSFLNNCNGQALGAPLRGLGQAGRQDEG